MQVGNRIIYDQDGEIIYQTGEMQGDVLPRKAITELKILDLEFGEIPSTHRIVGVDVATRKPILEELPSDHTPEEKIKELEDQLLLMADANTGGIL